jgi:hypothetical protein
VATNLSKNIDAAFSRRFEAVIVFGKISPELYEKVWLDNLPKNFTRDATLNFKFLQPNYPFTQGSILNVIRRLYKRMHLRGDTHIKSTELIELMKDELTK